MWITASQSPDWWRLFPTSTKWTCRSSDSIKDKAGWHITRSLSYKQKIPISVTVKLVKGQLNMCLANAHQMKNNNIILANIRSICRQALWSCWQPLDGHCCFLDIYSGWRLKVWEEEKEGTFCRKQLLQSPFGQRRLQRPWPEQPGASPRGEAQP